jgi:hypothetical protein
MSACRREHGLAALPSLQDEESASQALFLQQQRQHWREATAAASDGAEDVLSPQPPARRASRTPAKRRSRQS